jgi:acetyltransferase
MLKYAVNPVEGRDLALVAIADIPAGVGEGWVVGGARYIADSALESCEFAIVIDDDWQRSGLASSLMQELIRSARARGIKVMEGFILARNAPMRNLARRLGFETTAGSEGPGVLRACLDLRKPELPTASNPLHGGGDAQRAIEEGTKP